MYEVETLWGVADETLLPHITPQISWINPNQQRRNLKWFPKDVVRTTLSILSMMYPPEFFGESSTNLPPKTARDPKGIVAESDEKAVPVPATHVTRGTQKSAIRFTNNNDIRHLPQNENIIKLMENY